MSLYAWKITALGKPDVEEITSLAQLEAYLDASDLPGARPARPIIERTQVMQSDGQGVFKHRTDDEQWTLLWIALGQTALLGALCSPQLFVLPMDW
jgi:hypothetical protein